MDLDLSRYFVQASAQYKSSSQQIRVITEKWASDNLYCPKCGANLTEYPNNTKVYDFYCDHSDEQVMLIPQLGRENFQLKSMRSFPRGRFPHKIIGAEYEPTLRSLQQGKFPSLLLLHYEITVPVVADALLIHRLTITESSLEPRNPLRETARRRGWIGSNFLLDYIPRIGQIDVINNQEITPKNEVMNQWASVDKILKGDLDSRGWISDIVLIIEKLQSRFSLKEIYGFEKELSRLHPKNKHVKDKIRQQLQILRDRSYLEFTGEGNYKKLKQ